MHNEILLHYIHTGRNKSENIRKMTHSNRIKNEENHSTARYFDFFKKLSYSTALL